MEKLILLAFLFSSLTFAQSLEKLRIQEFDSNKRINKHRYGGISGLTYSGGFMWGISDDRGQFGGPRIYKHSIKDLNINIDEEILVKEPQDYDVVDYEALFRFNDGKFLISSEGDLNKKPRVFPFVRGWDEKAGWQMEVSLSPELYAEKIGMQTKGLQNNSAFEAMTVSADEKSLFMISEVPLFQNQKSELEFLEYEKKGNNWILKSRRAYTRDKSPEGEAEVMRGVSEMLYWKEGFALVLERWVRLDKARVMVMGAELFSVNLQDLKKKKLFTLDNTLRGNWEGLSWGPDLSDGRKLLILVSDNNFVKLMPTQYLFLAFKED